MIVRYILPDWPPSEAIAPHLQVLIVISIWLFIGYLNMFVTELFFLLKTILCPIFHILLKAHPFLLVTPAQNLIYSSLSHIFYTTSWWTLAHVFFCNVYSLFSHLHHSSSFAIHKGKAPGKSPWLDFFKNFLTGLLYSRLFPSIHFSCDSEIIFLRKLTQTS